MIFRRILFYVRCNTIYFRDFISDIVCNAGFISKYSTIPQTYKDINIIFSIYNDLEYLSDDRKLKVKYRNMI